MKPALVRKLVAIVIADVVGYTRLMERDESGTHTRLKELRENLIDPKIEELDGHIVRTAGDGMLIEFGSVSAALRCAIDVQRMMSLRNKPLSPADRIEFRFGINLGDIIVDGDDIAGDGVNIAARLETLAEQGGICVTSGVRDHVRGDIDAQFVDIGEQYVKNIARPLRVYRVLLGKDSLETRRHRLWLALGRRRRSLALGVAALSLAGIGLSYVLVQSKTDVAALGPPIMSIAVVSSAPASASSEDEDYTERVARALTTTLERSVRTALVVSHGLAAKYNGKFSDPRIIGKDLDVRYVVETDARFADDAIVASARLIDSTTGTQIWSDEVSALPSPTGAKERDVVAQLANRLIPAFGLAEGKRVAKLPGSVGSATDRVLRGHELLNQDPSLHGAIAARKLYEEALRLDPTSAPALIGLGWTLEVQLVEDPNADRDRIVKELDDLSNRAIRADRRDPRTWLLRQLALEKQSQWAGALEANAGALRIDPFLIPTLEERAGLLLRSGRPPREALALLDQAIALDPRGVYAAHGLLYKCAANLSLGSYDQAIAECGESLALGDDWWFPHFLLVAAYAQAGDMARATIEKDKLLEQRPDMSIAVYKALHKSDSPAWLEQTEKYLVAGLRKAGISEQ